LVGTGIVNDRFQFGIVITHGIILLDFLNEMMAQFCGNQTAHLWNFKMNSRIPGSNDGYQTTSKLIDHCPLDGLIVTPLSKLLRRSQLLQALPQTLAEAEDKEQYSSMRPRLS
jgi:hypothetical protein